MTASHHMAPKGFRNPWPGEEPRGLADLLRWRRERRERARLLGSDRRPAGAPPGTAPSRFEMPHAPEGLLTATWIGHATALLQLGGLNVLTDPMWSRRASPVSWAGPSRVVDPPVPLSALPPIDIVLISHNHYDHLDRATVRTIATHHPAAVWYAPLGVPRLLHRWGAANVRELDWWQSDDTDFGSVACVPARHFSARTPWDRARTLWSGWTIQANGWRVYFAGDTAYHPEFGRIAEHGGPFDLVLLPVGAYEPRWFMESVHMNPEDAVRAYGEIRNAHPIAPAPRMLPIHWGTFRLTDEPMDEPPARTRVLWQRAGLPDDALWLGLHGETRHREKP